MAATIDFSNFTFTDEQIRDINELIFDDVLQAPEITLITTLYPGIVFDREIGFIGEGGLVGKARQGCNPTPQQWSIGARKVTWQPRSWEILLDECWTDLESTAAIYALRTGVDIADFSDTDYMSIVVEVLSMAIKKFIVRLVWFSDTDAENAVVEELPTAALTTQTVGSAIVGTVYTSVSAGTSGAVKSALNGQVIYLANTASTDNAAADTNYYSRDDVNTTTVATGGIITPDVDVDYFNILDGLWKQLLVQATANPAQHIVVAENSGATFEAQELLPENAKNYLQNLKYKANMALRSKTGAFIACTQSFSDAYERYLSGKELESCLVTLIDGRKVLTIGGITIIPMPIWDEMIAAYENNGFRLNNPHRALFVIKEVLAVGVDGADSFEKMNIWYEKKERKVYTELMGKADAKLLNPAMFQLAI